MENVEIITLDNSKIETVKKYKIFYAQFILCVRVRFQITELNIIFLRKRKEVTDVYTNPSVLLLPSIKFPI